GGRKTCGVSQWGTEGSRRLRRQLSQAAAEAVKARTWTDAERSAKRLANRRLGLARHLGAARAERWAGKGWTPQQDRLLGTRPDEDVAALTGHTPSAVRTRRTKRGIPMFRD